MKALYTYIFFLLISASSFAQPYYVYTATKNGNWSKMNIWNIIVRTDGVNKTKVVIPSLYTVSVDNTVNGLGLGDVEIVIMGSLSMQPSTDIALTTASTIQLLGSGRIIGVSNTQKITINGVTKYDGSLDLTKTGASTASLATGVSPNGFSAASLLPVKFTSFTAVKNAGGVVLKWSTASEISNDYFEVERSYNGSNWTSVSTIKGTGSSTINAYYSYTDNNANGTAIYYRLKQVDINGAIAYSTVKTIRGGNAPAAKIYSSEKMINIELNTEVKHTVLVTVMNTNGQVIEKKQFSAGYKISMNINSQPAGMVVVNVADNNELNQTAKLML